MQTVGVNLICKIGSSYPDTAPEIEIEITDGLLPAQARELQQLANETAEANVGMPMGFTIAEAIREWLVENNISNTDGSMHANMLRRMDEKSKQTRKEVAIQEADRSPVIASQCQKRAEAAAAGEDDAETIRKRRLAEGTPVTAETFAKWSAAFEKERAATKVVEIVHTKLTGKQMFLQHLVKEEDEEELQDNEVEGGLDTEEQLFLEDGDFSDIDDIDDDDGSDSEYQDSSATHSEQQQQRNA
eukprot:17984-Heterococcus_DN1.PRE.1